ncbi:serine/arginine-rich splicing factor RS31-like [Wolffia australiana]
MPTMQPISSGFAFVYYEDEADANDAIRGLDGVPFGHSRRRLSVEWARGNRGPHLREGSKSGSGVRPTETLFVINFDPINTRVRDLERHFDSINTRVRDLERHFGPCGKITNGKIRWNFAFIQFETQEDATNALENTNMSKIMDRQMSMEHSLRDNVDQGSRPGDISYDRSRSPSLRRYQSRPSPDYGRHPSPDYGHARSPVFEKYNDRNYRPEPPRCRSRSPVRRRSRS